MNIDVPTSVLTGALIFGIVGLIAILYVYSLTMDIKKRRERIYWRYTYTIRLRSASMKRFRQISVPMPSGHINLLELCQLKSDRAMLFWTKVLALLQSLLLMFCILNYFKS